MPTFIKEISQPGQFYASTSGGKGRKVVTITPERQQGWIDQFYQMKKAGLKIPAPFVHRADKAGMPLTEEELKDVTSRDNGGFWQDFWIDPATQKLMGRVDIPLAEDAKRIGKTIQEVSPSVLADHTDGKGRRWTQEALMHVALVTNAADTDQKNFIPDEQEGAELGFVLLKGGFQMADDLVTPQVPAAVTPAPVVTSPPVVGGEFSAAVKVLQDLGLALPPDTNPENFIERIVSTGSQKIQDEGQRANEGTTTTPPEGASTQPTPVALSLPAQQFMSIATKSVQTGYVNRINSLVQGGSIPQKYASEQLLPLVNGFQLALDDKGQQVHSPIDTILTTLEAQPSLATPITGSIPGATGSQFGMNDKGQFAPVIQEPPQEGNQLQGEDLDKAVNNQISRAGFQSDPKANAWAQ